MTPKNRTSSDGDADKQSGGEPLGQGVKRLQWLHGAEYLFLCGR